MNTVTPEIQAAIDAMSALMPKITGVIERVDSMTTAMQARQA